MVQQIGDYLLQPWCGSPDTISPCSAIRIMTSQDHHTVMTSLARWQTDTPLKSSLTASRCPTFGCCLEACGITGLL